MSRLDLTGNLLTGPLFPSGLGGLRALTFLSLAGNSFRGSLSDALFELSSLEYLKLYGNAISSTLPSTLSGANLPALKHLDVSSNRISGTLAENLASLSALEVMRLGGNRLVGVLPPSLLSRMPALDTLELWSNALSGPVPTFSSKVLQVYNVQDNKFDGPVHPALCSSPDLRQLTIDTNSLSGSLPTCLEDLASLQVLSAHDCGLHGTLPPLPVGLLSIDLSNNAFTGPVPEFPPEARKNLLTLQLAGNSLVGSIPPSTWLLSALAQLNLANNFLTGVIAPEAGSEFAALTYLSLSGNRLWGGVPSSLAKCTSVTSWILSNNALTGHIPSFLAAMNLTRVLDLSSNQFSGSIPPHISGLHHLEELYLGGNALTSTLPPSLGRLSSLRTLFLSDNCFRGGLPTTIGGLQNLRDLDVSRAGLGGAVPSALASLRLLTNVLLQGNMLTNGGGGGDLLTGTWDFISPATQTMLRVIDLGTNQFTGTIPAQWFTLPSLQVFAAGANCLRGRVPADICSATTLESLVLDGATSGPSCKQRFWPRNTLGLDGTYSLQNLAGTIPSCLLALPRLRTLHLGGNGLSGHIPPVVLSPLLRDLSLCHNRLSGEIPETIQKSLSQLAVLDLSYNRLRGQLWGQVAVVNGTSTTEVSLIVNGLSGPVPASYQAAHNVSLLDGNLFSCDYQRKDLPQFDPYLSQFQCGSDVLSGALVALLCGSFVLGFLVFVLLGHHSRAFRIRLQSFIDSATTAVTDTTNNAALVTETLHEVRRLTRATSALVGLVLLLLVPAYGAFSAYFGIVDKPAAWSTTAAWKKGEVPASILIIIWTAILVINVLTVLSLYYQSGAVGRGSKKSKVQDKGGGVQERLVALLKRSPMARFLLPLRLLLLAVVNVTVVLSANVLYVHVLLTGTVAQQNAAVIGLSAFKAAWSQVWIGAASRSSWGLGLLLGVDGTACCDLLEEFLVAHCGGPLLETSLEVFNNILAPCIVTLLTDNTCFRQTLYAPPVVTTRYSYTYLSSFNFSLSTTSPETGAAVTRRFIGANLMTHEGSTAYTPPYAYSYKCGSVLVQQFTPVFLVDAVQEIVLSPVVASAHSRLRTELATRPGWEKLAALLLPAVPPVQAFFKACVADLLLILSFGLLCPFLALAKLVAVLVRSALLEVSVLHHVQRHDADDKLAAECAPLQHQHLYQARFLFLTLPAAFLSFFSTDIAGYHEGVDKAVWAPITMGLLPPLLLLGVYLFGSTSLGQRWLRDGWAAAERRQGEGSAEDDDARGAQISASSPLHHSSLSWLARLPQGSPMRPRGSLGLPAPPGTVSGTNRLSYTLQNAPIDRFDIAPL